MKINLNSTIMIMLSMKLNTINNNAQPVLDKLAIERLTQTVNTTKDALHGAQN